MFTNQSIVHTFAKPLKMNQSLAHGCNSPLFVCARVCESDQQGANSRLQFVIGARFWGSCLGIKSYLFSTIYTNVKLNRGLKMNDKRKLTLKNSWAGVVQGDRRARRKQTKDGIVTHALAIRFWRAQRFRVMSLPPWRLLQTTMTMKLFTRYFGLILSLFRMNCLQFHFK